MELAAIAGPPLANESTIGRRGVRPEIFTAEPFQTRKTWRLPSLEQPEERWGLLGVGLCPVPKQPRRRPRRRQESSLRSCLEACSGSPHCRSAAFSQRRGICLLARQGCRAQELTGHSSYATFLLRSYLEQWNVRTDLEIGQEGAPNEDGLMVFASVTSNWGPMLTAFMSALQLAGDRATLRVHHDRSVAAYANGSRTGPWPVTPQHHAEMRQRDRVKVNMLIRTLWDSLAAGARTAVLSDVDVQVFPGWARLVQLCTRAAHICVTQQPGVYDERRNPFNSGFFAFRVDVTTLAVVLDLAADFEAQFLVTDLELLVEIYPLEQDVISGYLFKRGAWLWAVFSPELVQIFVDHKPFDILKVKVQHACGSKAGDRLSSLFRTRMLYYSIFPMCLREEDSGPQHPCCLLYGHQRDVFNPATPTVAPFRKGSIYGGSVGTRVLEYVENYVLKYLPGVDENQAGLWAVTCEALKMHRMGELQEDVPQEAFLRGDTRPLPPGFLA